MGGTWDAAPPFFYSQLRWKQTWSYRETFRMPSRSYGSYQRCDMFLQQKNALLIKPPQKRGGPQGCPVFVDWFHYTLLTNDHFLAVVDGFKKLITLLKQLRRIIFIKAGFFNTIPPLLRWWNGPSWKPIEDEFGILFVFLWFMSSWVLLDNEKCEEHQKCKGKNNVQLAYTVYQF